ncbi:hypothetical protein Arub01_26880 [Actinomadura rubrobrunea]|uniref:Uncharacterized protein n=1 Tax=Actinomadura rubrobrunea TaxID=115335 RepID=A0A9W6UUY7_9ACTN|nr:hypothetical protein [Actinomadura rubrobrunea]GLW64444.1 hypothetical protein Arub01_26880 [Actinomadura rubrobrunea]
MTAILVLLCLAIAGRELYLAFERRRPVCAPELDDIRTQVAALKDTRDALDRLRSEQRAEVQRLTEGHAAHDHALQRTDARIRSILTQINERMLPEVTARLTEQREAVDRLSDEVARLRGHLAARLDQAVAASLGADPVDTVAGTLTATGTASRADLAKVYEHFAETLGLDIELETPLKDGTRYYLCGRSPRDLEREFFDLLHVLGADAPPAPAAAPPQDGGPHVFAAALSAQAPAQSHSVDGDAPANALQEHSQQAPADSAAALNSASPDTTAQPASSVVGAAKELLACLGSFETGCAQLGPLVVVRTQDDITCGVLALAQLRRGDVVDVLHDPVAAAARLRDLPPGRFRRLPIT